ncbi:hypothetical protein PCL1606_25470 [Pseudomonas chlororaphis]|uniref:Uncharacterized protein n=1 Tax=Pseudomonas chlororaphis TaxID=587753 RepID=A0A0D5XYW5_9PSED|nr:hypothetical protein PCL1606_25470 [Pseudomonas chlororaphis]
MDAVLASLFFSGRARPEPGRRSHGGGGLGAGFRFGCGK